MPVRVVPVRVVPDVFALEKNTIPVRANTRFALAPESVLYFKNTVLDGGSRGTISCVPDGVLENQNHSHQSNLTRGSMKPYSKSTTRFASTTRKAVKTAKPSTPG